MLIRETFLAGVAKPFNVIGNYFRFKRVTGAIAESLTARFYKGTSRLSAELVFADPGDKVIIPGGFDRVEVTSSIAQDVTFDVAQGGVTTDRMVGEVSVIDGELQRVKAGQCFAGVASQVAVAGQTSKVQLWNPGPGVRLVLEQLWISGPAGSVIIYRHNVAMPTLWGTGPFSKLSTGAAPVAVLRTEAAVTAGSLTLQCFLLATESLVLNFRKPFVVEPGWGIHVVHTTVNSLLTVGYEFFEEPL